MFATAPGIVADQFRIDADRELDQEPTPPGEAAGDHRSRRPTVLHRFAQEAISVGQNSLLTADRQRGQAEDDIPF
jgi:hypothetical protein